MPIGAFFVWGRKHRNEAFGVAKALHRTVVGVDEKDLAVRALESRLARCFTDGFEAARTNPSRHEPPAS
jgi:hypothetical protein